MRHLTFCALSLALAVSACSNTGKQPSLEVALKNDANAISYLEKLPSIAPKTNLSDAATWQALSTSEDSLFVISYEKLTPQGKGQVAHNLKISLSAFPDVGLQAEEVRIWGLTTSALESLKANKPTKIADRIDLTKVTYFGIENALENIITGTNKAAISIATDSIDDEIADSDEFQNAIKSETGIEKYEIEYGQITIDGLHWNGIANSVSAKEEESEDIAQLWDIVADYARWSLAFKVDAAVVQDAKGHIIMAQETDDTFSQNIDMTLDMPFIALAGYDRGNTLFTAYKNTDMQMHQKTKGAEPFNMDLDQGSKTGLITVRGFEISNLFSHLAKRELPPTSSTDVLSFGKWHAEDMVGRMGDDVLSNSASFDMDLSHFHWLIPTKITIDAPDTKYDLRVVLKLLEPLMTALAESESKEFNSEKYADFMSQARPILARFDVENLNFAGNFGYDWNPQTGQLEFGIDYSFKDLIGVELKFDGAVGDFNSYASTIDSGNGFNEEAFNKVFKEKASFNNAHYSYNDYGTGLDKIFGLVIAFSKLFPEEESEQLTMLQNTDATNLRLMASSGIRMAGMAAKDEFPQGVKWANLFADFVQKGGKIEASARPEKMITFQSLDPAQRSGLETPQDIIDFLGFDVIYEAPPETKAN